jgi:AcrR family transcriptional regulator
MAYRRTERGEERYQKRRNQLIAVARKLFTENGYCETSMQDVVHEAGTSIGNCYFYFSGKEALLNVVVKKMIFDIWIKAEEEAGDVPSGIDKHAYILYNTITMMLEHEKIGRLMLMAFSLPAVRSSIIEDYQKKLTGFSNENPALVVDEDITLSMNSVHGAAVALLEMVLLDGKKYEPSRIGIFFTRWNLQALGIPRDLVENALDTLKMKIKKKE